MLEARGCPGTQSLPSHPNLGGTFALLPAEARGMWGQTTSALGNRAREAREAREAQRPALPHGLGGGRGALALLGLSHAAKQPGPWEAAVSHAPTQRDCGDAGAL